MNTLIKSAVDHFLGWKFPKDFSPDNAISFDKGWAKYDLPGYWPVGTNLLTADQATAMFEYCLKDVADQRREAQLAAIKATLEHVLPQYTTMWKRDMAAIDPATILNNIGEKK